MAGPPPSGFLRDLGARIREQRESKRLCQDAVAAAVGLSQGAISRIENGRSSPHFELVHRIAEFIGCHIADFTPKRPSPP